MLKRYGEHEILLDAGWVPVSKTLLRYGAQPKSRGGLGLNSAELVFLQHLLDHKWDERRPYPAFKTLAARMGVSVTYARSLARDLEQKGYLKRTLRVGRTNMFDLMPLFDALAVIAARVKHDQELRRERAAAADGIGAAAETGGIGSVAAGTT